MYSKFFEMFQDLGAASSAKTEALQARAVFVNGVVQQSYRLWLTLLTTEITEAVRAAQELSTCRSPAEIADVQRAWFKASSSRAIASLQGVIEIANFLITDLNKSMTAFDVGAARPGVAASQVSTPAAASMVLPGPGAVAPRAVIAPPAPPTPPAPPVAPAPVAAKAVEPAPAPAAAKPARPKKPAAVKSPAAPKP